MGRDVVAGAALIAVGALYAGYAAWDLPLGSLRRMGPGLFPVGLGALLALFGACIAVPAIGRDAALPTMNARAIAAVMASVAAFALLIQRVGLVPSVIVTAAIASTAMPGRRVLPVALLCGALAVLTWVVFVLILHISLPLFRWRF
ncbi:tripartite tricarboxylate transporter TctB family protein [Salipiger sp.]|uniref:tripartite tricarboxylate transporter TctB family protein n=1 Tax=Salipiger sp. TaxID=2078585 RepID=UPI003A97D7B3